MSVKLQIRSGHRRLDAAFAMLLILIALAVRINSIGFNSFSEDETAKWLAVQQYEQGHFAGVNSEHPMMLKVLAWGSLEVSERWNRAASRHGWPTMTPEGWLRFPNVLLGAATAAMLYLLCRLMMGIAGSFAAGFFWAVSPLAIALNRLVKEETAFTFFIVLACHFYCQAKQAVENGTTRRYIGLSACAFGLATASQYMIHMVGLNALAWHLAGKRGVNDKPLRSLTARLFLVMGVVFLLANPVVLSPTNISHVLQWLHHDGIRHTGYDFAGSLYMNFPSLMLAGVPWYFYIWMLLVKTPIPILVAIVAGSILLLRDRRTVASCIFLSLGVVQLAGLSLLGAKWMRYSLPLLPFLYLAGGYAVQAAWNYAREKKVPLAVAGAAAVVVLGWPLLELRAWAPNYPFYLNQIGGGTKKIARYFSPDEVSEFDTREVAQKVCSSAPAKVRLATARPMSMTYYLRQCGRPDIRILPLYGASYAPQDGDLIVLEPSRRFFETQEFFDLLPGSAMARREVQVGPVLASTIYLFQQSALAPEYAERLGAQRQGAGNAEPRYSKNARVFSLWQPLLREKR